MSGNLFNNSLVFSNKSSKSIEFDLKHLLTYSLYISPVFGLCAILSYSWSSKSE